MPWTMSPSDGILLVDKLEGESSYDVIRRLKRALVNPTKLGHAGTLDPFASGLLIVMLGQGTKLSRFLMSGAKRYLATVRLGIETDTLDCTGEVTRISEVPELVRQGGSLQQALQAFVGEIEQTPPLFSAVKVGGKRAYQLARRGESIRLAARKVTVHALEVKSISLPDLTIEVVCSSGTYIRSLAMDLGKALGTGGHLISLRRLRSGPFSVEEGVNAGIITRSWAEAVLQERLIPLRDALPDLMAVHVGEEMAGKVRRGQSLLADELHLGAGHTRCPHDFFKLVLDGELVAIARLDDQSKTNDRCRVAMERVFV